jgi:hypothetical protein
VRVATGAPTSMKNLSLPAGERIHLRLRSPQQGFAPSPVQHNQRLCTFVAASGQTFNARFPERAPESRAYPLTMTYIEVADPVLLLLGELCPDIGCKQFCAEQDGPAQESVRNSEVTITD